MFNANDRTQQLLEQIAQRFGTDQEVRQDPGFCLEAVLERIEENLRDGYSSSLRQTLDRALYKGALDRRRRERIEQT